MLPSPYGYEFEKSGAAGKSFLGGHKACAAAPHDCLKRYSVPIHNDEGAAKELPPQMLRPMRFVGARGPNPRPTGRAYVADGRF
jgi:hypothetical protein